MPNRLADLRERHAGATIHIVGCGPSLDRFDLAAFERPGSISICVNHAIDVVPRRSARYWILQDIDVARSFAYRKPLCARLVPTTILEALAQDHTEIFRAWANDYFTLWRPQTDTPVVTRDAAAASYSLYVCQGTVTPAAHLAWFLGAGRVVFVGCDGGVGTSAEQANAVRTAEERQSRVGVDYTLMRRSAERVLRLLRVPFEHAGEEVPCDA